MASLFDDSSFQAEQDFDSLVRANDIENDSARVARARDFALRRRDELDKGLEVITPKGNATAFNNAVKDSKMKPK